MTRPTLVPALKALALSATATAGLSAADVGGLTIGGFVDTWLEIISYGEDAAPAVDNDGEPDELEIDFVAEVELQIGYKIGSNIAAQIDLEYYGGGGAGCNDVRGSPRCGGGGGGSGYVTGTSTTLTAATSSVPANNADPSYVAPAGSGGVNAPGSPGLIIISW